jgi:hypothetical protein
MTAMKKSFFICVVASLVCLMSIQCSKKCNCKHEWDKTITYHKNDKVLYHDTCWISISQGRGIVPGPWLQNSNDIWKPCDNE